MSSDSEEPKAHIDLSRLSPVPPRENFFRLLGPGLITGASDDDPSGIATYSQAGAKFGLSVLWTMVFSYPLMTAVQRISGEIGRVTGHGIAGNMRLTCPRWLTIGCIGTMVGANLINIGADIAAMGEATKLIFGGPMLLYAGIFAVGSLLLQVFIPYTRYVKVLKWLTLVLFSYVATVFVVQVPWLEALKNTFIPAISFSSEFLTVLAAIFGTTISPYLLFWQSSEEVEEVRVVKESHALVRAPGQAMAQLKRIEIDTYIGMAFSNIVAFFIMLTTAVTIHLHGSTDIQTASQAAEALRPVAGPLAFTLFSIGIVGTGLLALPVLAGSAAYAIGEAMRWRTGLEIKPARAKKFYMILTGMMLGGFALNLVQVDPIKALFWSAVINGLVAPPTMIAMMKIARDPSVMKSFVISKSLTVLGWCATGIMLAVAMLSAVSWFH